MKKLLIVLVIVIIMLFSVGNVFANIDTYSDIEVEALNAFEGHKAYVYAMWMLEYLTPEQTAKYEEAIAYEEAGRYQEAYDVWYELFDMVGII